MKVGLNTDQRRPTHAGPSGRDHDSVTRRTIELAALLGSERGS